MRQKQLFAFVFSLLITISSFSQKIHNWRGFYIGPDLRFSSDKLSIGQNLYNAPFYQITGVFVPARGIVIVPGTTRPIDMNSTKKTSFTGGIQLGYMKQYYQW